jgi:excisionase family DNA binding protein
VHRRQAVGGAGLDDTSRGCEREDGLCCASAISRADRVAPCLRDLPLLVCARARGGGSRCRSCEQNANDNCQRPLSDGPKRELLDFARDLPKLPADPQSSPEHKKRLLRIALKEIIATCDGETIRLVLRWQGRDHAQVEFEKIRSGAHRYVTDKDLVEIVRKLARVEPDARIASILNRNQRRTVHGDTLTAKRICFLRSNHAIPVYGEGERQARNEMSVSEASDVLGVTPTTVLRLIRLKQMAETQVCVGAPWIMRRADVERCMAESNHRATPPTVDSAQLALEIP